MKNLLFPKLGPWYMAQQRVAIVHFITLPMAVNTAFWRTWYEVYSANK